MPLIRMFLASDLNMKGAAPSRSPLDRIGLGRLGIPDEQGRRVAPVRRKMQPFRGDYAKKPLGLEPARGGDERPLIILPPNIADRGQIAQRSRPEQLEARLHVD